MTRWNIGAVVERASSSRWLSRGSSTPSRRWPGPTKLATVFGASLREEPHDDVALAGLEGGVEVLALPGPCSSTGLRGQRRLGRAAAETAGAGASEARAVGVGDCIRRPRGRARRHCGDAGAAACRRVTPRGFTAGRCGLQRAPGSFLASESSIVNVSRPRPAPPPSWSGPVARAYSSVPMVHLHLEGLLVVRALPRSPPGSAATA